MTTKNSDATAQRRAKGHSKRRGCIPFSLFIIPTHATGLIIFVPLQLHLNPHITLRGEANTLRLNMMLIVVNNNTTNSSHFDGTASDMHSMLQATEQTQTAQQYAKVQNLLGSQPFAKHMHKG